VASDLNREISAIAPEALALLQRYSWPGNVRELQHAVERAVILTPGTVLVASSFDPIRTAVGGRRTPLAGLGMVGRSESATEGSLVLTTLNIEEAEARLVERALDATKGNRTKAAQLLGVSVRTLRNKLAGQREASGGKS